MLAIITRSGTSLIDPASFKIPSTSFPISSSLESSTSAWSPDNSQLYLADSSSIRRYTPSECLLEEIYYGSDVVTCMEMKDENTILFATANKVWSLDCTHSPGTILSSLEPSHKDTVTRISVSKDRNLLASVSASAVFVHNLSLSSHTRLKGLPDKKPITCCSFHKHSGRLLLGVGRDIIVYDSTRPPGPLKTVQIPGSGDVVGVSASPFSKTLVAAITSDGDVALVDLDKHNGILKTINMKTPLTCCAFTAEGAAVYLGTRSGKLLILDLRSLETEPKSFTIGDGSTPIEAINVQGKSKPRLSDTARSKAKSGSATRTASTVSVVAGIKSPVHPTAAPTIRRGGGATPKKKPFSSMRSPLSETQNLRLDAQLATSRSPTLSRHVKPLRLQKSKEQEENCGPHLRPPSPTSSESTKLANAKQCTKPSSSHKTRQDVEHLGLGPAPESISGHLVAMRVQSGPPLNKGSRNEGGQPKAMTRRIISESVEGVPSGRKLTFMSSGSAQRKASSLNAVNGVARTQRKQGRRLAVPENNDHPPDLSDPKSSHEPIAPVSLGKNGIKSSQASEIGGDIGILGLTGPEVTKWAKGETQGREVGEQVAEMRKTRFAQNPNAGESSGKSHGSESDDVPEILVDERREEEREEELSMQVSPCRPTAPPNWLQSPHRPSPANLNMNAAAQDFLRGIVHDVMYDFQRETKAEMTGLHLDLVRMGREWKQELREAMKELNGEIKQLREENERLRRGY